MNILFSSYAYAPSLGGIETVSKLLVHEFVAAGHELVLITETPGQSVPDEPFRVIRKPNLRQLQKQLRWCDVMLYNNISLRHFIPALLARKPAVVIHQTWMRNTRGQIDWNDRIKRALVHRVTNVAISDAIARDFGAPAEIIGNPYDDRVFNLRTELGRDRDIVFVGRLVSDKGVDLLLRAAARLRGASLTVVGRGPEEESLRAIARELNVAVSFAGAKSGDELAEILNRHRIIAIPSRWPEPFGVVALEGIACGCVAVGSAQGGLSEAIGSCGLTFPNGDIDRLSECLQRLLDDSALCDTLRAAAPAHLSRFRASAVAARYLKIFERLAQ
jgi:glycogen synthase